MITEINGNRVADGVELIVEIRSLRARRLITLTVNRDGDTQQIDVTLGEQVG